MSYSYDSDADSETEFLSKLSEVEQENERYKLCKSKVRSRVKSLQSESESGMGKRFRLIGIFKKSPETAQLIHDDLSRFLDPRENFLREVELNAAKDGTKCQTVTLEFNSGLGLDQVKAYLDGLKQSKKGVRHIGKRNVLEQMSNVDNQDVELPEWLIDLKERKKDIVKLGRCYGPMVDANLMFPCMFEIGNIVGKSKNQQVFYPRYRWYNIKGEFSVSTMSLKVFLKHSVSDEEPPTHIMLEILIKSVVGYAYKTVRNLQGVMQDAVFLKLSRPPFVHIGKDASTSNTQSYFSGEDLEKTKINYERGVEFLPQSESIARSFTYFFYFKRDDEEDQREFKQMIKDLKQLQWYAETKQNQWQNSIQFSFEAYGTERAQDTHERVQQLINELDFQLAYQITSLITRGLIVEEALDPNINPESMLNLIRQELQETQQTQSTMDVIISVLDEMNGASKSWDMPTQKFKKLLEKKRSNYGGSGKKYRSMYNSQKSMMDPKQKCMIAKVLVTPTRIIPIPMQVELTNRVVRTYQLYQDRFSRAQFVDENEDMLIGWDNKEDIRKRIKDVMENGFYIGSLKFEWLHYSNSGLRQHSAWFFACQGLPKEINPESMRKNMGDFEKITNVPKYAARMGQCFSTTVQTTAIHHAICFVETSDIQSEVEGRPYSDGCGTISEKICDSIVNYHPRIQEDAVLRPCAFQIRYAGAKGMVCLNPAAKGKKLGIRDSTKKFDCNTYILEVCQVCQAMPAFLNRQIIMLLKTLGVSNATFHQLLSNCISDLKNVTADRSKALSLLRTYVTHKTDMTKAIQKLVERNFNLQDPLIKGTLEAIRLYHLKDMKKKAKIRVESGVRLLGVVDEFKVLQSDEVFLQVQRSDEIEARVIIGDVLITRNPCLYPGDIRMVKAVYKEELKQLVNVLVFNTKQEGTLIRYDDPPIQTTKRVPLSHMCAGGDLDGDDYFVTWDPSLFPPEKRRNPASLEYADSVPQKITNITARHCQQHFLGFMANCNIGVISNAHLVWADKNLQGENEEGAYCAQCIILAQEADKAVNFGKYGQEAKMPQDLKPDFYPHFMEKIDKPSYKSTSILGKLFDQIEKEGTGTMFKQSEFTANNIQVDSSLVLSDVDDFRDYLREAKVLRDEFIQDVWTIMCRYKIYSEQQLWCGVFLKPGNKSDRNNDSGLEERITDEMQEIFKRYEYIFKEEFEGRDMSDMLVEHEGQNILRKYIKASAWYACVYDSSHRGRVKKVGSENVIILGFGFIPFNELCVIKSQQDLSVNY